MLENKRQKRTLRKPINQNINMRDLLQESKDMLNLPLIQSRRFYLIIFNLVNAALTVSFMVSLKIVSGEYVVAHPLIYLYIASILISLITAGFNTIKINSQKDNYFGRVALRAQSVINNTFLDNFLAWSSALLILAMSFFGILGYGTSATAALFTNFSFAHSMIIASVLIIGRAPAVIWGCIVLAVLVVDVNRVGWNHEISPQTPTEARLYQEGLARGDQWALARKAELNEHQLDTINVTKHARLWIIFIIISLGIAIAFGGTVNKVYQVIPSVVNKIEKSIQDNTRIELERAQEKRMMEEQQRKTEEEKRLAEEQKLLAEKEALRAELALLKSQFDPHFIYNTLSYFYSETFKSSKQVAEGIMKLSDIMRYSLKEGSDSRVLLSEEIHYLKNYIDIHQLRFNHRLSVQFEVEGAIEKKRILPLVLISFVENAFKHGDLTSTAMPLLIRLSANERGIDFFIQNKKGAARELSSTGIGLANVKRRLDLAYQQQYELNIVEDEQKYTCQLHIYEV